MPRVTGTILGDAGQPPSRESHLQFWNDALLKHFFSQSSDSSPICRLTVTAEELKKAGASHGTASDARTQFISTLQKTIGGRSLGLDAENRFFSWNRSGSDAPTFLSHLLFTCMIANDLSSELQAVGDFRRRLTKVLGGGTNHGLERMKPLWEVLSNWLLKRSRPPLSCRPLQLPYVPTSGRFCIIGHPLRLAFPSRRDQNVLTQILTNRRKPSSEPTVTEVLKLVGGQLARLSSDFGEVFEEFRRAYRDEPLSTLYNTPFWSTVLEIAAKGHHAEDESGVKGIRLEVEDEDGQFVLNLTADRDIRNEHFTTVEIPAGRISQYNRLLIPKPALGKDPLGSYVVEPAKHRFLAGCSPRSVIRAASEGFLLFERSEDGPFEFAPTLPAAGELVVLALKKLSDSFVRCLRGSSAPSSSPYSGWVEMRGLRAERLLKLDLSSQPDLALISCLRKVIPPPRIRVIGGVKTDSGYLLSKAFMPSVEIAAATAVTATTQRGFEFALTQHKREASTWTFSPESIDQLEGPVHLLAKCGERYLASKDIRFSDTAYGTAYKTPSASVGWLIESGTQADMVPVAGELPSSRLKNERPYFAPKTSLQNKPIVSKPQKAELSEFLDVLASTFLRRKGLLEKELFELITSSLGVSGGLRWPLIQSWVDQGLLDCFANAHWRSRSYFGRPPALSLYSQAGRQTVVMTGLATSALTERFIQTASRLGMNMPTRLSANEFVPPVLAVETPSATEAEQLASELQLAPPVFVEHPRSLTKPLADIMVSVGQEPLTWEAYRTWDWSQRRFLESPRDKERSGYSLVWCRREDGPDYYKIRHSNATRHWSRSRNWSLLHLYRLADLPIFRCEGTTLVSDFAGLYLPLPLARFAAKVGPVAPGIVSKEGVDLYGYSFPNATCRDEVFESLYPKLRRDVTYELRRILTAPRSGRTRSVPIPQFIRRKLTKAGGPKAKVLGEYVPIQALPELFHFVGHLDED
jgi:hypothetical protein